MPSFLENIIDHPIGHFNFATIGHYHFGMTVKNREKLENRESDCGRKIHRGKFRLLSGMDCDSIVLEKFRLVLGVDGDNIQTCRGGSWAASF